MGDWLLLIGWGLLAVVAAGAIWFVVTFVREREARAATVTAAIAVPLLVLLTLLLAVDYAARPWTISALLLLTALVVLLLVTRRDRLEPLRITGAQERIDERDAIFHRFYRLRPDTPEFKAYYEQHPRQLALDDKIRELPQLAAPGAATYDPLTTPFQVASFNLIEEISRELEWQPEPIEAAPVQADPAEFSTRIKGFARYLGARDVGCTQLNPAYVYSHIGRSPGTWGEPIELDHQHAIAVSVEMSHEMVRHAPDSPTTTETAFQYLEVGKIAMLLARYINLLGYEARAHVDGNYRVMCVPIAADAGLGELSRLGLLLTPQSGPRVRLAVVTTNLPLAADQPIAFGVQGFCRFCKKCAEICPSGSIDGGDKAIHAGVEKWQSAQISCYHYWRRAGSDCSLCIKVCPYSHPSNRAHDLVRWLIGRNHLNRRLALWADDLAYGRQPAGTSPYPAWHRKS